MSQRLGRGVLQAIDQWERQLGFGTHSKQWENGVHLGIVNRYCCRRVYIRHHCQRREEAEPFPAERP